MTITFEPLHESQIRKAFSDLDLKACLLIRKKVFVEEQNVSEADEIDGLDEKSDHYIMTTNHKPMGTLRVRYVGDKAKVERVAILNEYRGKGMAKNLMMHIIDQLTHSSKVNEIHLSAQSYVIPFYQKLGFTVCSEEYMNAGILHKDMYRVIERSITKEA